MVDLDTNEEHTSVLFFNIALRTSLKPNIGKSVLARIGQGVAKPGKSAPWILIDATTDAEAVAKATAYLAGSVSAPAAAPAAVDQVGTVGSALTAEQAELLAKLGAKPF